MTFTESVKNEILAKKELNPCCKTAMFSAFIRGAGAIAVENGLVGFEYVTESEKAGDYFSRAIKNLYGEEPVKNGYADKLSGKTKYCYSFVNNVSFSVLKDAGVLSSDEGGIKVNLNIDKYVIENDCCKKAYVAGAFLGSGSATVPDKDKNNNTGYHLEFVFSKKQTADDFCEVLSFAGFMAKLIKRKESYVVYFKNAEEISDVLAYIGAVKSCLRVKEIMVEKDLINDTNRKVNCEMGNIGKQIEASLKQVKSVEIIKETIGLQSLPEAVRKTAEARCENPGATLLELADILKVTKSCLNHRLRKINEIADNLK